MICHVIRTIVRLLNPGWNLYEMGRLLNVRRNGLKKSKKE